MASALSTPLPCMPVLLETILTHMASLYSQNTCNSRCRTAYPCCAHYRDVVTAGRAIPLSFGVRSDAARAKRGGKTGKDVVDDGAKWQNLKIIQYGSCSDTPCVPRSSHSEPDSPFHPLSSNSSTTGKTSSSLLTISVNSSHETSVVARTILKSETSVAEMCVETAW